MTELFQYDDPEEYERVHAAIYNYEAYYCNREKGIIIKNAHMIKYLELYKVRTYEGQEGKLHYKDVYDMFLTRIFQEASADFKVSKHLKKKMKGQWAEKHAQVKAFTKGSFKSHQWHAIELIRKHVRAYKARKAHLKTVQNMEAGEKAAIGRWLAKTGAKLSIDSPLGGVTQPGPALGGGIPPPATTELATLDPSRPLAPPKKNMDENPQEFDEVGSQEEQSQGRALEQIHQRGRGRHEEEKKASQERKDSMDDRENLPDLKMDQSITDSKVNRSEMNLLDSCEKEPLEEGLGLQGE